jgi:hypothetical protein
MPRSWKVLVPAAAILLLAGIGLVSIASASPTCP